MMVSFDCVRGVFRGRLFQTFDFFKYFDIFKSSAYYEFDATKLPNLYFTANLCTNLCGNSISKRIIPM